MKKLLISFMVCMVLFAGSTAKADAIDNCIKCPGLEAIFALKYRWVFVA